MNTRNNNKWSIAINGGAGELVGIVEENCNWFIAEEMLYDNAQMVVDLHNSQAVESPNSTPNKQSAPLPKDIRENLQEFAENQVELYPEHSEVLSKYFWDLI